MKKVILILTLLSGLLLNSNFIESKISFSPTTDLHLLSPKAQQLHFEQGMPFSHFSKEFVCFLCENEDDDDKHYELNFDVQSISFIRLFGLIPTVNFYRSFVNFYPAPSITELVDTIILVQVFRI